MKQKSAFVCALVGWLAFHGPTESLIQALRKLLKGEQVIVPARQRIVAEKETKEEKYVSFRVGFNMKTPFDATVWSDTLLDLPPNRWVRRATDSNPAVQPGRGIGGALGNGFITYSSDGAVASNYRLFPLPVPDYQGTCYLPDYRRFIVSAPGGTYLANPLYFNRFGPAGGDLVPWAFLHNHSQTCPRPGKQPGRGAVAYDPQLQVALFFVTAEPTSGVYRAEFHHKERGNLIDLRGSDEGSKGWQKQWPMPREVRDVPVYTTYDTARQLHIVWTGKEGQRWWTFNSANGEWKRMADLESFWRKAGNAEDDPYPENSVSLGYDIENRLTVAAIKGKKRGVLELWAYEATKDTWKPLTLEGERPPGTPAWNQLAYDPVHKCFFLLNVLLSADGRPDRIDGFFVVRPKPAEEGGK